MKRAISILTTLLLGVTLIAVCAFAAALAFFGLWLHTYNVFTERVLVAEVSISESRIDANGEYADVVYQPFAQQSALNHLFTGAQETTPDMSTQTYKLYGDTVHIGGPIVRFYDHLILVNFKTIYKVGTIYGRYNFDNNKELNRKVISSFELNGGIDPTWRDVNDRITSWPYNMFVNFTNVSSPGIPISKARSANYYLYMSVNGFIFEPKTN